MQAPSYTAWYDTSQPSNKIGELYVDSFKTDEKNVGTWHDDTAYARYGYCCNHFLVAACLNSITGTEAIAEGMNCYKKL